MTSKTKEDFFKAVKIGDLTTVQALLESKQVSINDRDVNGCTALHLCSDLGNLHLASLLLKQGADVNLEDDQHRTPLKVALDRYHARLSRLLIQNNALPIPTKHLNQSEAVESFFVAAGENDVIKVKQMLNDKMVDVDATDAFHFNGTALHVAARYDYVELAKVLVEFGAELDVEDDIGDEPVHTAMMLENHGVADYLLQLEEKKKEDVGAVKKPDAIKDEV
ncbi:putative ankyrin repeat protein RF_0381 [Plutella xylostella]|uniref:putative ankyrin repeat protein RF_0381 n=1 Tax=Plutella xylostella TaxID=51655 RepID=UPI002032C596|nr:putative ankyrin repeat protein RF_0381 [Plutella xylostella]